MKFARKPSCHCDGYSKIVIGYPVTMDKCVSHCDWPVTINWAHFFLGFYCKWPSYMCEYFDAFVAILGFTHKLTHPTPTTPQLHPPAEVCDGLWLTPHNQLSTIFFFWIFMRMVELYVWIVRRFRCNSRLHPQINPPHTNNTVAPSTGEQVWGDIWADDVLSVRFKTPTHNSHSGCLVSTRNRERWGVEGNLKWAKTLVNSSHSDQL